MAFRALFLALLAAVFGVVFVSGGRVPYAFSNLNVFSVYHNSLTCLANSSTLCPASVLNETGKLYVSASTAAQFCTADCQTHITTVLQCINKTSKYGKVVVFHFNNNARLQDVAQAASTGCQTGNFSVVISK